MKIAEWVRDNKLLTVVIVVVIIYILIVLGTRQAPVAKEAAPTEEKAELPAEEAKAPAKARVSEPTPEPIEKEPKEQINQTQVSQT